MRPPITSEIIQFVANYPTHEYFNTQPLAFLLAMTTPSNNSDKSII
jgi:hypothetical protein